MKLLVTDYDNTLEIHYEDMDKMGILKRNIESLDDFMKNNIVCIATGRHFDAIDKTLKENGIKFDYLCANNGAELYDREYKLISCIPLDNNDLMIIKKLENKYEIFYRNPYNSCLISSVNLYLEDIEVFKKVREYLDLYLRKSFIEYKFPKIKIINSRCNKVLGIEKVKEIELLSDKDIYTIGDDINDLKMIKKYRGYSLKGASLEVRKNSVKVYDELNQLIRDIIRES